MMGVFTPMPWLRFVERPQVVGGVTMDRVFKVLQQFWAGDGKETHNDARGEWRDVPLEKGA
ncbi:MAG: hypothetical protein IT530_15080 [Burkholderiales bacterium]|nr:hypothetical protein [Burkholderiales bacterium]